MFLQVGFYSVMGLVCSLIEANLFYPCEIKPSCLDPLFWITTNLILYRSWVRFFSPFLSEVLGRVQDPYRSELMPWKSFRNDMRIPWLLDNQGPPGSDPYPIGGLSGGETQSAVWTLVLQKFEPRTWKRHCAPVSVYIISLCPLLWSLTPQATLKFFVVTF